MKNISVGKKILSGFMAVILMIVVILAMTVITSLQRNRDLERVTRISDMQHSSNIMLNNFNLARVEIRELFLSIDAEEQYNKALDYLDVCTGLLDELDGMAAGLDGYHAEDFTQMRSQFQNVRDGVLAIGENDENALASIARMQESGQQMFQVTLDLYASVQQLSMEITAGDWDALVERTNNVVAPVKQLGDTVNDVRVNSRRLMLQQDVSVIPELTEGLDSVEQQAAAVRAVLATEEAKASVDGVTNAVGVFRTAVEETSAILAASDAEIETTRAAFLELNTLVNGVVDGISQDVANLNDGVVATSQTTMLILIVVGVVAVIFSIIVATVLGRMITRPLNKMKSVMLQAGEKGNLDFDEQVKADIRKEGQAKDEIGQSLNAFAQFVDHVINMSGVLGTVASRDLTVEVHLLSDEDTMGLSLQTMLDTLNHMFADINSISAQVATASNEIAMGAQSLAQGSTEQASTVQEISASVNQINEQMSISNTTANEAANDSLEMSRVAEDGNQKMGLLSGSMQEINEASQNIGNVIKVIDDIAFQTNILALNAAVEAARAGQHGKGFAVVADEVRSLAGKSAAAAKETAALISSNIDKTEQGMEYTRQTADSLTNIMEGIEKTSSSLQTVATQADSAQAATGQVTQAIEQVAQVVQQNSATSEESAAASEEMSSQAQVLRELISQFKLKNIDQYEQASLPAMPEDTAHDGEVHDDSIIF